MNVANVSEDGLIVEIGPGAGALTKRLAATGNNILCYEIDEELRPVLNEKFGACSNVKFIFTDFMKRDVLVDLQSYSYRSLYIIANLPYYITTPILSKIIGDKLPVTRMILMVQKEVADRLSATIKTKDYNAFTVFIHYYFKVKKVMNVSRHVFYPEPNVDSAVVCFDRSDVPRVEVKDEDGFFQFVRDCFRFKRKNLRNNLKDYDFKKIEVVLNRYGYDLTVRAEALSIPILADLYNNL